MTRCLHVVALVLSLVGASNAGAADASPEPRRVGRVFDRLTFTDLDGKPAGLRAQSGEKATVVVFLSLECPISNSYIVQLSELARAQADRGVALVGAFSGDETPAQVRKWAAEYKPGFPILLDPRYLAAQALSAESTPEAFVFDADLVLRYRGRIDNAYSARLKRNASVTSHDLTDALDDVLAGKGVRTPLTKAVGCALTLTEPVPVKSAAVSYHRDVVPILQKHCQNCHRPGEIGPMSLLTYRQARNWASDLKELTQSRKMPPWMPTDGPAFRGQRRLGDKEVATLAAWADAGAPEGDPKDAPPPLTFTDGWQSGPPDLVLSVKDAFHLGASGRDVFRCFVMPTGLTENKWVIGYEVRPGSPRVVHHTLNFFDATGAARGLERKEREKTPARDAIDHGPGYSVSMGVGFLPPRWQQGETPKFGGLGGWAPGQRPHFLPKGAGFFLPKESDFLLQVHYHRNGREADDQTRIGLYFAKGPIEQPWQTLVIAGLKAWQFIPAGDAHYVAHGTTYLQNDAVLHSVMPHMHLLGKSVKVTMTPPGGKPRTLVEIGEWDYRWQETYWFQEPITAPRGTKLEVEAIFDNSPGNPNNPNNPPKAVFQGEQTTNEMLFVFIGATSGKTPWERVRARPTPPGDKETTKPAQPASERSK